MPFDNEPHDDIKMCLKGAAGELLVAMIDDDTTNWLVAPEGNWGNELVLPQLSYQFHNGEGFRVKIVRDRGGGEAQTGGNPGFIHTSLVTGQVINSNVLGYKTWDGQHWNAYIRRKAIQGTTMGIAFGRLYFFHDPVNLKLPKEIPPATAKCTPKP